MTTSPRFQAVLAEAHQRGREDYLRGCMRSPSCSTRCRELFTQEENYPNAGTIMRAWLAGWDEEDLKNLHAAMRASGT